MMIDRRLVGLVPESRRYTALSVGFQWIALVANICLIAAVCRLLGRIFGQTAAAGDLVATAVVLVLDVGMLLLSAWVAWGQAASGQAALAGVLVLTVALMGSFGPVIALANLGSTLQSTFAAGNRVLDILDETPKVEDVFGREPVGFEGAAARDVVFSYDGEPVLRGISLDAPEGSIVGITGRSGSGKSTLLKLFMRFWEPDAGVVEVSGRDVSDIDTAGPARARARARRQDRASGVAPGVDDAHRRHGGLGRGREGELMARAGKRCLSLFPAGGACAPSGSTRSAWSAR